MGATFDKDLLASAGGLMAIEAKAKRVHTVLGPTVNIQRSPLGGRGFESFSEDPVLSGLSAAAIINGMQKNGIQATIKHFVCNDHEDERTAVDCVVSERALREIYLMPFQLAVRDSAPGAVMSSYNKVNGVHVSESKELLKDILRKEWGWDGMVMSDWGGVYSTAKSLEAGCDLEMPGPGTWRKSLVNNSLASKELHPDVVDECAERVLKFIDKCVATSGIGPDAKEFNNNTPETARLLREISSNSVVLLKNEGNILPLSKEKTTAVIGSNAFQPVYCGGGSASLLSYYAVSPLEGITKKTEQEPLYALGANAWKNAPNFGRELKTPSGEKGWQLTIFDKPRSDPSRKKLDQMNKPETTTIFADYVVPNHKGNVFYGEFEGFFVPQESGSYQFEVIVIGTAKLYVDDKLVVNNAENQKLGDTFFGFGTVPVAGSIDLKAGQKYKISVEYGSALTSKLSNGNNFLNGCIKVGAMKLETFEESLSKAVEVAKKVDQVVLVVGLNGVWETEGFDRKNMDLPPNVDELVEAVAAVNPNTVVVVQSGTPVTLPWTSKIKGIMQAWYAGNETGNGIADVVFGDTAPSGKLPLSYPKRNEDNPAFLDFKSDKGKTHYSEHVYVGYRYYEARKLDVLFPFGHGLSYTTFNYKNLRVQVNGDVLDVCVDVTNTGDKYTAKEAVQFYVSQSSPSLTRPPKELKDYSKVELAPGQTKTVTVAIPLKYATSYWDESASYWVSDEGEYELHAAASSADVRLSETFTVAKTLKWKGL